MQSIKVSASQRYTVHIGSGLLANCGEIIKEIIEPCKAVVVTDHTVEPLFAACVRASLAQAGFTTHLFTFAPGERSKNLQTLSDLLECFAVEQLTRSDCVIALGGGVVGDLSGFAAGCYLRGIRYVQLPTTLLAAVDSSVGGKTGVDLSAGKNLAGLFWQPSAVICDTDCLATLPHEIFLDGLVEAIKTGILGSEELFALIESGAIRENTEDIIASCVAIKASVVASDERESGARKVLNLGHTVGHALEACSNYSLSHGSAVAAGIAIMTRAAMALGTCDLQDAQRIVQLLESLGLPLETEYSTEQLVQAALHDKKRAGDTLTLVLPERIGSCVLREVNLSELSGIIDKGRGKHQ
ncbi:MAG: 3-dehydroquinate synthase [Coriobacteriales bacterium]|jgi:3-dehydroquinate synthase|nr:3-dehydroquinate synthase [Coriobacteriales bacterium]